MMNRYSRSTILCFAFCTLAGLIVLFTAVSLPIAAQESGADGLVTVESAHNVDDTVDMLTSAIEERGLLLARVVDHAANAASVELELRPTKLILFGNPALGTQLMNNGRTVGLDLPQKYLVWEDESGVTHISYNSPQYLVERHGLTGPQEAITAITGALQNFANLAALPAPEALPVTGATAGMGSWWLSVLLLIGGALCGLGFLRKRTHVRIWTALLMMSVGFALFYSGGPIRAQDGNGLIQVDSAFSVDETVARLQDEIAARELNTMLVFDHAANAASVDQSLLPTKLIIFGNPRAGTPLMQSQQSVAIDLPQKILVWEDDAGAVHMAYNDPAYLGARHGIADRDELLARVSGILADIAGAAAVE